MLKLDSITENMTTENMTTKNMTTNAKEVFMSILPSITNEFVLDMKYKIHQNIDRLCRILSLIRANIRYGTDDIPINFLRFDGPQIDNVENIHKKLMAFAEIDRWSPKALAEEQLCIYKSLLIYLLLIASMYKCNVPNVIISQKVHEYAYGIDWDHISEQLKLIKHCPREKRKKNPLCDYNQIEFMKLLYINIRYLDSS